MQLKGKVAVVTGASMGIGEAIARRFVQEGALVVLTSRDAARVEEARQRIGSTDRTMAVACDVKKRADLDALVAATLARFGRIDIWINNAGHGLLDSVEQMSVADCRAMFETNLFGAIEAMQAVAPQMKRQGGGTIINISSVASLVAVPYLGAYCASKSALNAIGRAARIEWKRDNIHVGTVCPGYVATNFSENAIQGKNRQRLSASSSGITPERVANAVLKACVAKKINVVVPWKDYALVWIYRLAPLLMDRAMAGMLRPADQVPKRTAR